MKSILLIEDCKETFTIVSQALDSIAELSWADTINSGQRKIDESSYDLVLLDIELPDGNGIDLCSKIIAKNAQTSIFFLTAHESLSDKVLGFSAGADDYITKPFAPLELKARIEAKFKKIDLTKKNADILKWPQIKIDKLRQEVQILENEKMEKIDLTSLEFKLLSYLAHRPHVVIPRDELLDELWGEDVHVYSRSVDTHISKLRKKLRSAADIIESVHGSGYKFNP